MLQTNAEMRSKVWPNTKKQGVHFFSSQTSFFTREECESVPRQVVPPFGNELTGQPASISPLTGQSASRVAALIPCPV